MKEPSKGVLNGYRVLDLSEGASGGYCTRLLAGLGADVVKVERPEVGDSVRHFGPFPDGKPQPELSALHLHLNAGKRSITLDIREPTGRQALLELLPGFDAVIESFSSSEALRLGLTPEKLRAVNPHLHVISVTPWGRSGPYSDRAGNELTVEALGGFASLHGDPPRAPLKAPGWQMECFAGIHAAIGTMVALFEDGPPRHIDVATVEAELNAIEPRLTAWEFSKPTLARSSYTFGLFYPLNIWPCKDGWLALTLYYPRDWDGFVLALGDDELREDERYHLGITRLLDREEFDAKLNSVLMERTMKDVFEAVLPMRSATGMVLDAATLLVDPHLEERRAFAEVEHPVAGRYSMPAAPFKMSEPAWSVSRAPLLGEHTQEVLAGTEAIVASPQADFGQNGSDAAFEPLKGIRVLDLSTAWAAPYTNRLLGVLGADVIKIESPVYYDVWRGPVDPPPGGLGEYADNNAGDRPYERTPLFGTCNRNKRAISLDLSRPEGRDIFFRLIGQSDAVVSNYSARVLPNFGLDYETLKQVKPDIIMLAMPAYGATGPYRDGVAYGSTIEAMAGFSARFGYRDGAPTLTHEVTYGDPVAGAQGALAVAAALLHRKRTGRGMFIDLSQQETLVGQLGEAIVQYSLDGTLIEREEAGAFAFAPHGYYPCQGEDQWIAIAVENDKEWHSLLEALGNAPSLNSPRFSANAMRLAQRDELDKALAEMTTAYDKMELWTKLVEAGVKSAPALSFAELRADRHIAVRKAFEIVDHPEVGPRTYQRVPFVVDGQPLLTRRPTPLFAQHNREVYQELLGIPEEELGRLDALGIISNRPVNPFPVDAAYYRLVLEAVEKWLATKGAELAAAMAKGEKPAMASSFDMERYQRIMAAIREMQTQKEMGDSPPDAGQH